MNSEKHALFLARFRPASDPEIQELACKANSGHLVQEAVDALHQVFSERGIAFPIAQSVVPSASPGQTSEEWVVPSVSPERTSAEWERQKALSTELWNGSLAGYVHIMFAAQALFFSAALLGATGLQVGALWVVLFAGTLCWAANRLGRQYTRKVCASADRSIAAKKKILKWTAWLLVPVSLVSSIAGSAISLALRGV